MFVPDAVAYSIENDAPATMIIVNRPPDAGIARHLWHDLFGEHEIAADEVGGAALSWIHTAPFSLRRKTINGAPYDNKCCTRRRVIRDRLSRRYVQPTQQDLDF